MRKHRLRTLLGAKTAAREVANRYPVEEDFEHRIRVMLRYRWLVLVSATLLLHRAVRRVLLFPVATGAIADRGRSRRAATISG